ncbi:uncharacterized protein EURHEDRAFT_106838 [Aspergillus ruber CBS 135680]|uniref:Uncharacterized protein n=1 Tax=Aspergillus ruber (strain CBS 135680) TaxID=1388766 RepID=A0A017SCZ9_ASPRC|nr:uncharacterized protein EURHEDRAFT_106838 [Aspergillus ruber CBS 135680]EYE94070.1 hypothetical protein EURHEDRAFT_106838 [Aspergillus ruber CBS 135680]
MRAIASKTEHSRRTGFMFFFFFFFLSCFTSLSFRALMVSFRLLLPSDMYDSRRRWYVSLFQLRFVSDLQRLGYDRDSRCR